MIEDKRMEGCLDEWMVFIPTLTAFYISEFHNPSCCL